MRRTIDSFRRETARRLRANSTNAEAILWRRSRHSPVLGTHFRRQLPIGRYVVDFACMAARLIIEVDGSQHAEGPIAESDRVRTLWLEGEGYRVLRFWNNDITENIDGVLEAIHHALSPAMAFDEPLKHKRETRADRGDAVHPTPARTRSRVYAGCVDLPAMRRPSTPRGG